MTGPIQTGTAPADARRGGSHEASADPIGPLKRIFWGMLICILDFKLIFRSGAGGFQFDVVNDVIGTLLIVSGVASLCRIPVNRAYAGTMQFIFITSCIAVLQAMWEHIIFTPPPALAVVLGIVGMMVLLAAFLLCQSMRWLSAEHDLPQAAESWRITALLTGLLWLCPNVAALAIGFAMMVLGRPQVNLTGWGPVLILGGLVVLAIALVPIIHFRVSISRMSGEIEQQYNALQTTLTTELPAPMGA